MPSYEFGRSFKAKDESGNERIINEYIEYGDTVHTLSGPLKNPTRFKKLTLDGKQISPVDGEPGKLWYFVGAKQVFLTTDDPEYLRSCGR